MSSAYLHGYLSSRPLEPGWKYGWRHAWTCTCGGCIAYLDAHDRRSKVEGYPRCGCPSCRETRKQLAVIEATRATERKGKGAPVAQINICDRPECGSMAKSNAVGTLDAHTGGNSGEQFTAQLCPACVASLMEWWEEKYVGPRDRAYSKAWARPTEGGSINDMSSAQLMQLAIEKGRDELNSG